MTKSQASVVIPAYNEEKNIKKTLESLTKQVTDVPFEVLVIDNNSTDQTPKVAKSFQDQLNLKVILETTQGRGPARARGFKEANSEIILSLDADTIVPPNWVDALVKNLTSDVVATTTTCRVNDLGAMRNAIFNVLQPVTMRLYKLFLGHFWLNGFSCAIRKDIYYKAGGFNVNLQAQEDLDLAFRVSKLGRIKLVNTPVIFSGRRFKNSFFIGMFDYIRTFTEAFILRKEDVYLNNPR